MNIDFNRMPHVGGGGFDGVHGPQGGKPEKAGGPAGHASAPLTVTTGAVGPSDGIAEVPESALRRDDRLGQLMALAFSLPGAERPVFD